MANIPQPGSVEYVIYLDAAQALVTLTDMADAGAALDARIEVAQKLALELGNSFSISGKAAVSILKQTETSLNELGMDMNAFGAYSKQAWNEVGAGVQRAENDMNALEHGIDFVRVALGTLSAMIVFQVVQAITSTFRLAIDLANQYADSLYKIQVAQDILAKGGVSIKQQDLLDMADAVQKQFGVFSHVQMQEAVANAALLTREFGFTKDQISQVVQIGSALAIQQGDLKNVSNYIEQVTRALTSGTAPAALSKLGIDITATQVKELGAELYGVNHTLTDQEKAAISLTIAYQHMNGEIQDFTSFQKTLPGTAAATSAAWQDTWQRLGTTFAPVLKTINEGLLQVAQLVQIVIAAIAVGMSLATGMIFATTELLKGQISSLGQWESEVIRIEREAEAQKGLNPDMTGLQDMFKAMASGADTATQAANNTSTAVAALDAKSLDSLINSVNTLANQLDKLNQKFAEDTQRSLEDYQTKLQRAQEDYQQNVANTIAEFNLRRANLEASYRNNEKTAEERFQEQMRQIREKYLFDLEDALRNRDARQVLRLMEQYKMQTEAAENQFKIEQDARRRQYQQELADLKRQEQLKLQEMAQAEALKEQRMAQDFATEQKRRQEDYQQQLTDLQNSWQDKLQMEAQKLGEQYNLNDEQTKQVYGLLNQYYGPGGMLDKLYDYSYASLVARAQALLSALNQMLSQFNAFAANVGNFGKGVGPRTRYKAKGGMDIVDTATETNYGAVYGEAGPEAHLFFPLSGSLSSFSLPTSLEAGEKAGGGKLSIALELSPDLVARVTENTLNKNADIITRIIGSKG